MSLLFVCFLNNNNLKKSILNCWKCWAVCSEISQEDVPPAGWRPPVWMQCPSKWLSPLQDARRARRWASALGVGTAARLRFFPLSVRGKGLMVGKLCLGLPGKWETRIAAQSVSSSQTMLFPPGPKEENIPARELLASGLFSRPVGLSRLHNHWVLVLCGTTDSYFTVPSRTLSVL